MHSSLLKHRVSSNKSKNSLMTCLYLHKCKSLAAALEAEHPSVNPCPKQKPHNMHTSLFFKIIFSRNTQSFQYLNLKLTEDEKLP